LTDLDAIDKVQLIAEASLELKAENVIALDMTEISAFADAFVILSGRSDRHVRSIANAILGALRAAGDEPLGVEGLDEGRWVLIDANDVVVHVFAPETRETFDLERLWSDAPTIEIAAAAAESQASPA
jgi:ribosome-associated protein